MPTVSNRRNQRINAGYKDQAHHDTHDFEHSFSTHMVLRRMRESVLLYVRDAMCGCEASQGQLTLNRLSNNVGDVKHFRAHYSMHSEKSAISLSWKRCRSNQGSLAIKFQVRNSVRPMHLFGPQPRS